MKTERQAGEASAARKRAPKIPAARVMSAARKDKISDQAPGPLGGRLKSEAESTALNLLARGKEGLEAFRLSDRFFKYKAAIVASWFAVSVATLIWAPPHTGGANNGLGASLVVTTVLDHPVYMVKNEGSRTWREVVVVVNRTYRAAAPEVQPGQNLTIGPRQLLGENGSIAPRNLELQDFELRTAQGNARLVEAGRLR
jgi:hypothetical protein